MSFKLKNKEIKITQDMVSAVHNTGASMNSVIEEQYGEIIAAYRESDKYAKASATKLALIDNGITGDKVFGAFFATETNEYLYPAYIAELLDETTANSDIMSYLVSGETPVEGTVLKAPTLDLFSDENKKNLKKAQIAEGAEIPRKTIKLNSTTVELFKKGIAIEQTYEAAANMRIDLVARMLRAVSMDIVGQNVAEATKVLESVKSLAALGTTGAANTVTAKELFDACMNYYLTYKIAPTTILADTDMFKSLASITHNSNEIFGANQKLTISVPQIGNVNLTVLHSPVSQDGGKNRALVYNKDLSLQRFTANGLKFSENGKNVLTQTEFVTMTEISGFANLINSVGVIKSA